MIAPRSFPTLLFQAVYRKVHMILCHDLIFHLRLSEVYNNFVNKQKSNFDHSSSFLRFFHSDLLSFITTRILVSSQDLLKLFVKVLVKKSPNSNKVFG